jgi:hypothetical protein
MILADLERTLSSVLASGQLGTPVAVRIHATLPDAGGDPLEVLGLFRPLIRLVSGDAGGRVQAQKHSSGKQATVLWTDADGRTVFLSVVSIPNAPQSLHVLLVGNHGITQLSGGDLWNEPVHANISPLWPEEIRESLKTGTSIEVLSS